ncbi:MAG: lysine--tRNA ligase [Nanoarchaeota archaeon]|nr:lysine--tRNA ligase [Nanoarchaeota archaeon]
MPSKKDLKIEESMHWADQTARKIIVQKGNKKQYVCAAGITPSGIVHIGNFREIITVELVARAFKSLNKKVKFLYSWDDYDVFRKVPKGWPKEEELKKQLRRPIVDVFDPFEKEKSFAAYNESLVETDLLKLGIKPEYKYQAQMYRKCSYKQGMKKALQKVDIIKKILNEFRSEPLPDDWLPLGIFDPDTKTDEVSDIKYLGGYKVSYKDKYGHEKQFDFSKDGRSKLLWRVDWPMRWEYEKVDFEPGGKDHSTYGGSFTTAKEIAKQVYNFNSPLYIMYDFIRIKGTGGKISSSKGDVITLCDILGVYEPEIVRYLFAGTRPKTEFAISFDLDVIKIYEDFDRTERIYYNAEDNVSLKEKIKQKRIYELSCIGKPQSKMPFQPSFRHLCNIVQICENDFEKIKKYYKIKSGFSLQKLKKRADCVNCWLKNYAPQQMKFKIVDFIDIKQFNKIERQLLASLREVLKEKDYDENQLFERFYEIIKKNDSSPKQFFTICYKALINNKIGPKLAPFLLQIGKDRIIDLLKNV